MDDDGVGVRIEGSRSLALIGHAADVYYWPCLLVPQPGLYYENQRQRMIRKAAAPSTVGRDAKTRGGA